MRILVTGCTGFAGGWLVQALLETAGGVIYGLSRQPERSAAHLAGLAALLPCDLGDRDATLRLLRQVEPDRIFHLAGYAQVGQSFREADRAWEANLTGTRNLYEAILRWGSRPRVLYVSSALVYGAAPLGEALTNEDCALRPLSPYAASKAAADLASYQYGVSAGLEIVRARAFNHIGPRQSAEFAVAHFARQLAAIEQGRQPPLLVTGDLSRRRDLTDVRDMVRAYLLLMERGRPGEAYNVGTGAAHAMQAVLDRLLALARVRVEVRQDPQLFRAQDTAALRADATKVRRETGWAPHYSLEQTLTDILEFWRTREASLLSPDSSS